MLNHFPQAQGRCRCRAAVLLVLWLQVATANLAACALDHALHPAEPSAHAIPDHHADAWSAAMTTAADCGEPQLLVLDCVAPPPAQPPEVKIAATSPMPFAGRQITSPVLRIDPPPPRA